MKPIVQISVKLFMNGSYKGLYAECLIFNFFFRCYVAEDTRRCQLIGYILFFNTLDERGAGATLDDPVAVVEDLFVKPAFRGRGVATQLWRKVLKVINYRVQCTVNPRKPTFLCTPKMLEPWKLGFT